MIAYDKTLLENTLLVTEAIHLKNSGFIQQNDLNAIKKQLNGLKTNRNVLVRIGFLLLGILLYLSIIGFVALVSLNADIDIKFLGFFSSLIGLGILELFCSQKMYRHGLDDAFLIGSILIFCVTLTYDSQNPIGLFVAMLLVGFAYAYRYVSTISFLIGLTGLVLLVSYSIINYTTLSSVLPFVLLLMAIGFYSIHLKFKQKSSLYLYQNLGYWLLIYSLVLGYAAVNYFVVRNLSEELLGADYSESDLPFGWVFYGLMFVLPLLYILYSLKTKNRTMLYIGGITLGLSFVTFRYYNTILSTEWALIFSGSILFTLVYFSIQKLKKNSNGITFLPDRISNTEALSNLEAIISTSQNTQNVPSNSASNMPFGGGDFSGGGSGGSF